MYFSKLLLTYRHALAQSERRCARGERKARFTTNEGVWMVGLRGGEPFMDDG